MSSSLSLSFSFCKMTFISKALLFAAAAALLMCATSAIRCPDCGTTPVPYPLSTNPNCGDQSYKIRCSSSSTSLVLDTLNNTYTITSISPETQRLIIRPPNFFPNTCATEDLPTLGFQLNNTLPFNVTASNTIMYLNCNDLVLRSPLNCSSSSLCHSYINSTREGSPCRTYPNCCTFRAGGSTTSYSIRVREAGCLAYQSFVNLDPQLPVSRWPQPGLEIQWVSAPEPLCGKQADCDSNSVCRLGSGGGGIRRCFCSSGFHWDPVLGLCADSELTRFEHVANNWWKSLLKAVGGALGILLLCTICYFIWRKHRELLQLLRSLHDSMWQKLRAAAEDRVNQMLSYGLGHDHKAEDEKDGKTREWKLFSFSSIVTATDNFSSANKLGEGGFGPVYKGKLVEGQEVAIKRLSRSSGQGVVEFKNEITLIAKLQHTNLVRLLGCCVRGEEKILIYEYMPNKSLDSFLFDPSKKNMLNWGKRLCIIEGIVQGLIYLHKYSRLRIIHRDLKASNILLDNDMNPKISDFGLARIFELHESEANTNRVVGTYGYMPPEYAMQGIVSMKIDVFSFGVLLLEIVSGKKNNSFYHYERPLNLVGYAWELWKEDRAMELVDPALIETCPRNEVILRCVHVGLLCAQDHAEDRPNMTDVVAMLSNETMELCAPKQPAFFVKMNGHMPQMAESKCDAFTVCNVSISELEAR